MKFFLFAHATQRLFRTIWSPFILYITVTINQSINRSIDQSVHRTLLLARQLRIVNQLDEVRHALLLALLQMVAVEESTTSIHTHPFPPRRHSSQYIDRHTYLQISLVLPQHARDLGRHAAAARELGDGAQHHRALVTSYEDTERGCTYT